MDKGFRRKAPAILFAVIMSFMMLFGSALPALALEGDTEYRPDGVTGTSSASGAIKLRWLADEGVIGYFVYRATEAEGEFLPLAFIGGTEYEDQTAQIGQTYYYKVRGLGNNFTIYDTDKSVDIEAGDAEIVSVAHRALMPLALPYPAGSFNAEGISHDTIVLTFNRVEGAEGYSLLRSDSMAGPFDEVAIIPQGTTAQLTYTDNYQLEADTDYYYMIATIQDGEPGDYRQPVHAKTFPYGNGLGKPVLSIEKKDEQLFELSWLQVQGATGYRIYRAKDSNADSAFDYFDYSTNLSLPDNTAKTPGSTYYYYIIAESATNDSEKSNIVNATVNEEGLPAPVIDLELKPNEETTVIVSWELIPEADHYKVYRKESETGTFVEIANNVVGDTYEDPGRTPSSTYWYQVIAVGAKGESGPSNVEHITIPDSLPPTEMLSAVYQAGTNNIDVTWKPIDKAERYEIQVKVGSSAFTTYTHINHPTTSLTFPNAPKGITYTFRAYVKQGTRTSVVSNEISVKEQLDAPMNLVAQGQSTTTILTTWTQVDNNYGYRIYRSDSENGTYSQVGSVGKDVTEYLDSGLQPDTTYWYQVYAIDAENELGKVSNKAQGTTFAEKKMEVKVVPYTYCCNRYFGLVVSWTPVSGATSYTVYRSTYDGNYKKVNTTRYNTYDDMTLPPNTTYWYKIVANTGEEGIGYGTTIGQLFQFRAACTHHYGRELGVVLTWRTQTGVTHYTIQYSLNNRDWTTLIQVPGTTRTYTHKPVSPRTDYYYRILGSNGQIEQAYTKTCGQALSLTVRSQVGTMVLTWKQISNANSYAILRSTDGKVFRQVDLVGGLYTTWTDTTPLTYRQRYYYKVVSDNFVEDVHYAIAR